MPRSDGALFYLEGLGEPFMFLEERVVRLPAGASLKVDNMLPKFVLVLEGSMRCDLDGGEPVTVATVTGGFPVVDAVTTES